MRSVLLIVLLPGLASMLAGCRLADVQSTQSIDQELFLRGLMGLEGGVYPGEVDESQTPENPFAGLPLSIEVLEADTRGARIAMRIGDDRSRTWVLTRARPGSLHLRHEHVHEDGTPHEVTNYGGYAAPEGSARRQVFPADRRTARMIPEAKGNVWALEMTEDAFIYALSRDGRARFRAVFDLGRRSE